MLNFQQDLTNNVITLVQGKAGGTNAQQEDDGAQQEGDGAQD